MTESTYWNRFWRRRISRRTVLGAGAGGALGAAPPIAPPGFGIVELMYTYMYSWNRYTEEAVYNNLATDFEHPDDLTFIYTIRPDVVASPTGPAAGQPRTSAGSGA